MSDDNPLWDVDLTTSTIVLDGRFRLPAVLLICPPDGEDDTRSELDHSLGTPPIRTDDPDLHHDREAYIPLENGVLVHLKGHRHPSAGAHNPHLELALDSRTCERTNDGTDAMWIPWRLSLINGFIVHEPDPCKGTWYWDEAEPDWIMEFLEYLGRCPYLQPPGPEMQLVRLDYFEEIDA